MTESVSVDKYPLGEIIEGVSPCIGQQQLAAHAIEQHARECKEWFQSVREARRGELKNARTARKNSIRMWLIEQGWEPEMAYFDWDFIAQLRIIREPKWLTPRIIDNISSPLTEWMMKLRDIRIEKTVYSDRRLTLMKAYEQYLKKQKQLLIDDKSSEIMPRVADVSAFQPFDAIIRSLYDNVVTAKSFRPAFAQLPTLVSAWRQKIEAEFVERYLPPLPSSTTGKAAADDPTPTTRLKLASSIFVDSDGSMVVYPAVLAEWCFISLPKTPKFRDAVYEMHETLGSIPWSVDMENDRFQPKLFEPAADIIRICTMNPDTATFDDMDMLSARLECAEYSSPMTWREAISRSIEKIYCDKQSPLQFNLVIRPKPLSQIESRPESKFQLNNRLMGARLRAMKAQRFELIHSESQSTTSEE